MTDFDTQLEIGRRAEKAVGRWLMSRGWLILPVYDYSGLGERKAPKLVAAQALASLVVPDLLACRKGLMRWAEVKWKLRADWTRSTQRKETGISKRLWLQYFEVHEQSGLEVWIVFVHQSEGEVRGASLWDLVALTPRYYDGGKMGRGGMVFFPYDRIPLLAQLSDVFAETGGCALPPSRTEASP